MSNNNNSNGGNFLGLLAIAFIVLKLTKYIDWSWWWVTAPLWGALPFVVLYLIYIGIKAIIRRRGQKERLQETTEKMKDEPARKSSFQQRLEQAMEDQKKKK